MAERRMFTKKVTDDDHFLNLSSSAQALYLHLMMAADDDGFCNQVTVSLFKAHASIQDLQSLLENRYLYQFDNGVIVIKHFRMANALRKDRYTPTAFQEELAKLSLQDNGAYTWQPSGNQTATQYRLDKDSIDKNRLDIEEPKRFHKPTLEEVKAYCLERNNTVDPERFYNYYESTGWKRGKTSIKDWRACVRTWESKEKKPQSFEEMLKDI